MCNIRKDNTAIIFGCSPFVKMVNKADINYLINNYYHIGINNFIDIYSNIKTILFSDCAVYDWICPKINNQNIIISKAAYEYNFIKENREKPKNIEFIYDARSEIFHDLSLNMLCMYKTSALPALNYLYLKGYKNIVLCGVDLTQNWNHFYEHKEINRPLNRIERMRSLLYQFKDYVNIYQLNQKSDLEIDKINIFNL